MACAQPAYLCTPTDVHVIPEETYLAIKGQARSLGLVNLLCLLTFNLFGLLVSNLKRPVKTADGSELYLVDGLVNKQGPNYALAKRMQHWRAVTAREEHRCFVSSNIAPSTATASVVSNRLFAMAYGGMSFFKPMEVFEQETSNAVMCSLLLRDVFDEATPANPSLPVKNPLCLFSFGSFHGGVWRIAYTMDSIGTPSVLAYLLVWLTRVLVVLTVVAAVSYGALKVHQGQDPIQDLQAFFFKDEL